MTKEYLAKVLDACAEAKRTHDLYQSCRDEDPNEIWDARARAFDQACELVGAYWHEIDRLLRAPSEPPACQCCGGTGIGPVNSTFTGLPCQVCTTVNRTGQL